MKKCDTLVCKSGIFDKETKTLSLKGKMSNYVPKFIPASPIGFGNCLHEETCGIIIYCLIKYYIQCLDTLKQGSTTRYTKRFL